MSFFDLALGHEKPNKKHPSLSGYFPCPWPVGTVSPGSEGAPTTSLTLWDLLGAKHIRATTAFIRVILSSSANYLLSFFLSLALALLKSQSLHIRKRTGSGTCLVPAGEDNTWIAQKLLLHMGLNGS